MGKKKALKPDDILQSDPAWAQFDQQRDHHLAWYNKASDLHAAAGVVWLAKQPERDASLVKELGFGAGFSMKAALPTVYTMLWGLALELAMKAVIVAGGRELNFTHDLVELAKQAEVQFTNQENALLKYLSGCVIWDGKYPVPKERSKFLNQRDLFYDLFTELDPESRIVGLTKPTGAGSWEAINLIWNKIMVRYWALVRARRGE